MRYLKRTALAIGLVVVIAACLFAQAPSGAKKAVTIPPGSAGIMFPAQPHLGTFVPAPPRASEPIAAPVKVELTSGEVLTGDLQVTGPLECETIIGVTGIPVNTIQGIRQHERSDEAENNKATATVVLANNDSLTVTVRVHHFEIKTEWGTAIVNTAHIRSILLTMEHVEWREGEGGRWYLVRKDEGKN